MSAPAQEVSTDPLLKALPAFETYRVLEPYVLYSRLGVGGMGAVYRARHVHLDVDVAVKVLKRSLADDDAEFVSRFEREARLAAQINDPHLIRVTDVGRRAGLHFLVMEMIQGENARQRVRRKGPLDVREALQIALGAARGLAAAHRRNIIHRDIKPDNILISNEGEVKVADLGLARAVHSGDTFKTATGAILGTPQYMPPEQWEDMASVAAASDVWALGATLYFLLTGADGISGESTAKILYAIVQNPFPRVRDARAGVPAEVDDLVAKATDRDPAKRFAEAAEMARAIESVLGSAGGQVDLADAADKATMIDAAVVSPPPSPSLIKLREMIDSGLLTPPTAVAEAVTPRIVPPPTLDAPLPTLDAPRPAPRSAPAVAPARSPKALVFGAVLLVIAAALGTYFLTDRNGGDRPSDPPAGPPKHLQGGGGTGGGGMPIVPVNIEPKSDPPPPAKGDVPSAPTIDSSPPVTPPVTPPPKPEPPNPDPAPEPKPEPKPAPMVEVEVVCTTCAGHGKLKRPCPAKECRKGSRDEPCTHCDNGRVVGTCTACVKGSVATACTVCAGHGALTAPCARCSGLGTLNHIPCNGTGFLMCSYCGGGGIVNCAYGACAGCNYTGRLYCGYCQGSGRIFCCAQPVIPCDASCASGRVVVPCTNCAGSGRLARNCNVCGGKAIIAENCRSCAGSGRRTASCNVCQGAGEVSETCKTCRGRGVVKEMRAK